MVYNASSFASQFCDQWFQISWNEYIIVWVRVAVVDLKNKTGSAGGSEPDSFAWQGREWR